MSVPLQTSEATIQAAGIRASEQRYRAALKIVVANGGFEEQSAAQINHRVETLLEHCYDPR
jgi:hypothetical protein